MSNHDTFFAVKVSFCVTQLPMPVSMVRSDFVEKKNLASYQRILDLTDLSGRFLNYLSLQGLDGLLHKYASIFQIAEKLLLDANDECWLRSWI